MRPRRRIDPEKQRQQMQRDAQLLALSSHPAWPAMREEVEVRVAEIEREILVRAMSAGAVDQRRIDYLRGVRKGIIWLVGVPDGAERSLEKALADQGAREEEDVA